MSPYSHVGMSTHPHNLDFIVQFNKILYCTCMSSLPRLPCVNHYWCLLSSAIITWWQIAAQGLAFKFSSILNRYAVHVL
jgi:hypothetical protein